MSSVGEEEITPVFRVGIDVGSSVVGSPVSSVGGFVSVGSSVSGACVTGGTVGATVGLI